MAEPPQLRPAQVLQFNGGPLGSGTTFAIPCVTDWNGDGRKDLLAGYQTAGKIALYLNSGTDAHPVFTNISNLQYFDLTNNAWKDISFPSSGCGAPAPWVCDFDGDGKRDLLVGAGADGTVWFFRNTNTDAHPILINGVQLKVGSSALSVGARATPCFHDWDEDGRPDLLCGTADGSVYFFKNTNTVQAPIFAPAVKVQAGGKDLVLNQIQGGGIDSSARSVVRVLDWDGDGLKDLVCSSDTGVYWCRNTNSNSNPILQTPVPICAPVYGVGLKSIITGSVPGARMRLFPVDWNNDGVMDLLLGNADGTVYYYEGYRFAFTRIAPQPEGGLLLQWNSATNLKYNLWSGSSPASIQTPAVTNLPSAGSTTLWTNSPQGGTKFYRVQIAP